MAAAISPATAQDEGEGNVLVIAHRGASGARPEHTLSAYELAIDLGADYIEIDLVPTRDGVLVARHENELSTTTDIADRPEFASRRTTKMIDGEEVTGWFSEDFTLAEIRTLRARERLPEIRPDNARFDGLYPVPTFAEIIALVRAKENETGRVIGLYPEIKHPAYFAAIGHDLATLLLEDLHAAGYEGASAPVFIQSFDVEPLVALDDLTEIRLVQLVDIEGGPADDPSMRYADMLSPEGLSRVARYADGVGVPISLVLGPDGEPTPLVRDAHANGLLVHAWTVRNEHAFLPEALHSPEPGFGGNMLRLLLRRAGVDGIFDDHPRRAVSIRAPAP